MRRALVLVAVAVAWLGAPSVAAAQSTVSVQMTGAGTVALEVAAGTPAQTASCPEHPDLDRPDTGPGYEACSVSFAPTCAPTTGSTCLVRVRATPRVPGAPDLDASEAGGWRVLPWTAGPCAGDTGACLVTIGTCSASGCAYADAALGIAFDDIRDPTALVLQGPPEVSTDPNGVASFLLGSNEYKQRETARLTCLLDGVVLAACRRRPEFAVLTGVSDGPHTLEVRATDPSGRTGPSVAHTWRQAYPPAVTFDARPAAVVATGDASFAFHADREATFTCRLDGGDPEACDEAFEATGLADGHHTLAISAKRTDVDVTSVTTAEWIVDTVAPESVITGGPEGDSGSRTATFTFALAGGVAGGSFECSLDDRSFEPCGGSSITYQGLADGPHSFAVRAVDAAGNREEPPQQADWNVVIDADGDGVSPPDDCDDGNPAVFPFADDQVGNGIDEDCDGADGFDDGFGTDRDGDGDYAFPEGSDCDDTDPDVNSFGLEVPENDVDEDCDGADQVIPGAAVRFKARWVPAAGRGSRLAALKAVRVRLDTVLRLKVACPEKACPRRTKKTVVEEAARRLDLLPYLPRLGVLPAGAVLEVRASRPGRHPEGTRWKVRAGKAPRVTEFCERRGKRELGRC